MAHSTIDRITDDAASKLEQIQNGLKQITSYLPSAKEMRSYLPGRTQKRGIALPIALAIGGLAFIGGITLLAATAAKPRRFSEPLKSKEAEVAEPPSKPAF